LIEQKDVMSAIANAAGGAVALGAGFATISAGVAKIANSTHKRPALLAKLGIGAFFAALLASLGTVAWTWASSLGWNGILGLLYWASIALFVLGMVLVIIVFGWSAAIVWRGDLTNFIKRFS
jgi:hypothetical protein